MFTIKQTSELFAFVIFFFSINSEKQNGTIYVLIWTLIVDQRWNYRDLDNETGHVAFVRRNCTFQNCYLITNQTYFESVLDYDVFIFNTVHLNQGYPMEYLPDQRSPSQLYVLFSVEPAAYTSFSKTFDGIFNLTWTYVLDSDIVHPYFFIKNNIGEIIGPKIDMNWLDINDMPPIDPTIVKKFERKRVAALWVVSNCAPKLRVIFAQSLNHELSKYGHRVDIYGRCGNGTICQKNPGERDGVLTNCYSKIESDYYFYLALENTFSDDYVSAKVLHGLLHFSVPIVYGGAIYSRFLPDGSYLNAMGFGVEELAKEIVDIIEHPQRYYDFFKWRNYYTFQDAGADDYRESVCAFCAFLNNRAKRNETRVYKKITTWWNAAYPALLPNTPFDETTTFQYNKRVEIPEEMTN